MVDRIPDEVGRERVAPEDIAIDHGRLPPDVRALDRQCVSRWDHLPQLRGQIPAHVAVALEEVIHSVDCALLVEVTGEGAGVLVVHGAAVVAISPDQDQGAGANADEVLLSLEGVACEAESLRGRALANEDRRVRQRSGVCDHRDAGPGHLAEVVLQLCGCKLRRPRGFLRQHDARRRPPVLHQRQALPCCHPDTNRQRPHDRDYRVACPQRDRLPESTVAALDPRRRSLRHR